MKDNLKKYKLDVLLDQIGNESREMFINNESMTMKYIQGTYKKWPIYQTIWDMIDISYLAICSSNDYKRKVLKREDIVYLINEYRKYDEELSSIKMDQIDKKDTLLYILYGHSQAQFIYQSRHLVIEQINRNIELLQHTSKKINSNVDIDLIVKDITGFDSEEFNYLLFFINLIGLSTNEITNIDIPNIFSKINPKINNENVSKIVELYSATYREYRESGFEKHHLKFKPIIKTDNKKILISNQYLLYNLLAEGLYWIIRNYFNSKGRQDFTNVFGLYYEKYLEDICTYYLDSDKFKKLVEDSKSQICDWQIETSKYILLVEQKSALASIFTKNIHPDIKQIKSYLKRLGKGFNQLKTSEDKIKNPDNKIIVKLLVHYESLYMPEILEDEIIKTLNKSADEYMNTFLATSSDIERIIYALSQGDDILNRIIDQKLYLEKINDTNGRSFSKILDDNYISNDYLKNVKNHYEKMVEKCRLLKTSF